jgi:hypothetical protein
MISEEDKSDSELGRSEKRISALSRDKQRPVQLEV